MVVCLALIATAACNTQPSNQQQAPAPASGPAAAVQANSYQGVGVVKSLNPKRPGIEINHEEVVGLMPAMEMEFPRSSKDCDRGPHLGPPEFKHRLSDPLRPHITHRLVCVYTYRPS